MNLRARFDSKPATSTAAVGFSSAGLAMVSNAAGDATLLTATIKAANAAGNELLPALLNLSPGGSAKIAAATAAVAGSV
jgi:hypothetical protein